MCGDLVVFDVKISDGIVEARHTCKACVLTSAFADIVAEYATGKSVEAALDFDPVKLLDHPVLPNRIPCLTVVKDALCTCIFSRVTG